MQKYLKKVKEGKRIKKISEKMDQFSLMDLLTMQKEEEEIQQQQEEEIQKQQSKFLVTEEEKQQQLLFEHERLKKLKKIQTDQHRKSNIQVIRKERLNYLKTTFKNQTKKKILPGRQKALSLIANFGYTKENIIQNYYESRKKNWVFCQEKKVIKAEQPSIKMSRDSFLDRLNHISTSTRHHKSQRTIIPDIDIMDSSMMLQGAQVDWKQIAKEKIRRKSCHCTKCGHLTVFQENYKNLPGHIKKFPNPVQLFCYQEKVLAQRKKIASKKDQPYIQIQNQQADQQQKKHVNEDNYFQQQSLQSTQGNQSSFANIKSSKFLQIKGKKNKKGTLSDFSSESGTEGSDYSPSKKRKNNQNKSPTFIKRQNKKQNTIVSPQKKVKTEDIVGPQSKVSIQLNTSQPQQQIEINKNKNITNHQQYIKSQKQFIVKPSQSFSLKFNQDLQDYCQKKEETVKDQKLKNLKLLNDFESKSECFQIPSPGNFSSSNTSSQKQFNSVFFNSSEQDEIIQTQNNENQTKFQHSQRSYTSQSTKRKKKYFTQQQYLKKMIDETSKVQVFLNHPKNQFLKNQTHKQEKSVAKQIKIAKLEKNSNDEFSNFFNLKDKQDLRLFVNKHSNILNKKNINNNQSLFKVSSYYEKQLKTQIASPKNDISQCTIRRVQTSQDNRMTKTQQTSRNNFNSSQNSNNNIKINNNNNKEIIISSAYQKERTKSKSQLKRTQEKIKQLQPYLLNENLINQQKQKQKSQIREICSSQGSRRIQQFQNCNQISQKIEDIQSQSFDDIKKNNDNQQIGSEFSYKSYYQQQQPENKQIRIIKSQKAMSFNNQSNNNNYNNLYKSQQLQDSQIQQQKDDSFLNQNENKKHTKTTSTYQNQIQNIDNIEETRLRQQSMMNQSTQKQETEEKQDNINMYKTVNNFNFKQNDSNKCNKSQQNLTNILKNIPSSRNNQNKVNNLNVPKKTNIYQENKKNYKHLRNSFSTKQSHFNHVFDPQIYSFNNFNSTGKTNTKSYKKITFIKKDQNKQTSNENQQENTQKKYILSQFKQQ